MFRREVPLLAASLTVVLGGEPATCEFEGPFIGSFMRGARASLFPIFVAVVMLGLVGCPNVEPAPPICLDAGVDPGCTPAYAPTTYDALYTNTLRPSCAKSGVSCHASTGKQGGVNFDDAEEAFATLSQTKVRAGEPACSILVHRILATDGKVRMPPGASLPGGEQCAIIKWIAEGAKR